MGILHEKIAGIHIYTPPRLFGNLESPDNRTRKTVIDRLPLGSTVAYSTERVIRPDKQDFWTDTMEFDNLSASKLAPVETDVVGSQSCRQGIDIEKLNIQLIDFDEIAAKDSFFEKRVAHGYFVISAAAGMFVDPGVGPVIANYGIDNLRFVEPVGIGDTIQVKITVKRKITGILVHFFKFFRKTLCLHMDNGQH